MAPKKPATKAAKATKGDGEKKGRAVILNNGVKRADYIRKRYYDDGVKRGDIVRELKAKFDHEVPYQIVFAATKEKTKPVPKPKAAKKKADDKKAA